MENLDNLHFAAEQGNASAQYRLGLIYCSGKAVLQDYAEAAKWIRKAAEQGHVVAQYHLGNIYRGGKGVGQDDAKAAEWYRRAAEQKNAASENLLAVEEAALVLGLAVSTLNKHRVYGTGPPFIKLGRAVRYRPADLDAWIDANRRASTSEEAGT